MGYIDTNNFFIQINPELKVLLQSAPQSVSWSHGSNYEEVPIIGRSEPFHFYGGGGSCTLSFEITFIAESNAREEVIMPTQALMAATYPEYRDDSLYFPPTICYVKLGYFTFHGILQNCSVNYEGPWTKPDYLPLKASLSLEFTQIADKPRSWDEVAENFSPPPGIPGVIGEVTKFVAANPDDARAAAANSQPDSTADKGVGENLRITEVGAGIGTDASTGFGVGYNPDDPGSYGAGYGGYND